MQGLIYTALLPPAQMVPGFSGPELLCPTAPALYLHRAFAPTHDPNRSWGWADGHCSSSYVWPLAKQAHADVHSSLQLSNNAALLSDAALLSLCCSGAAGPSSVVKLVEQQGTAMAPMWNQSCSKHLQHLCTHTCTCIHTQARTFPSVHMQVQSSRQSTPQKWNLSEYPQISTKWELSGVYLCDKLCSKDTELM